MQRDIEAAKPNYLIRADASELSGTGHVMRMIALGQMLQDNGGSVHFVTTQYSGSIMGRLEREGFVSHVLKRHTVAGELDDVNLLIRIGKEIDAAWIILDGYNFKTAYQESIKNDGFKLMYVDDLALHHCVADILLNQNLRAKDHNFSVEAYTSILSGPENVLLRREFIENNDPRERLKNKKIENILITLGGSDPKNLTLGVLQSLEKSRYRQYEMAVILGPLNPHCSEIEAYCSHSANRIRILKNLDNKMPLTIKWADLCICSAGSTIFEVLYYKIPLLCCIAVDNQKINYLPDTSAPGKQIRDILADLNKRMHFFKLKQPHINLFDTTILE